MILNRFTVLFAAILLAGYASVASAQQRVQQSIDPARASGVISEDFLGLSYETSQMLPRSDGTRYFGASNKPLVALFKTLGVKSLRIGGNSVDSPQAGIPTDADIDSLFGFARAAGVKVIYSVRLQNGDPQVAARTAKYIQDRYADLVDCFAIGNEPSYLKPYETYREKWKAMADAMLAAAPGIKIAAPDTNPNPEWCRKLVEEFGKTGWFRMITEHDYPGGGSYSNSNAANVADLKPVAAAPVREKMLSTEWHSRYDMVLKSMTDAVAGTPIPFRLSETNSLWYGGLQDASDTFASALWSIDYLYWWAGHGAKGLNFHTGDRVGGGDKSLPSRYAAFVTAGGGYDAHPLSYGMKLFDLGGHGALIPVTIPVTAEPPASPNFSVFATVSADRTVSITFINRSHGGDGIAMDLEASLPAGCPAKDAKVLLLSAPGGDIAAKAGITLGGSAILAGGRWSGHWSSLKSYGKGEKITLRVPAATAALVQAHVCSKN